MQRRHENSCSRDEPYLERLQEGVEIYEDDLRDLIFARVDEKQHVGDSQEGEENQRGLHSFPADEQNADQTAVTGSLSSEFVKRPLQGLVARLHQPMEGGGGDMNNSRCARSCLWHIHCAFSSSSTFTCTGLSRTSWKLAAWSSGF